MKPHQVPSPVHCSRLALTIPLAFLAATPHAPAQLHLQLQASGTSENRLASNIVLHVPSHGTPSPFLPAGPFSAQWSGSLSLDLRDDFQFQAHHAGLFSLEINGTNVLQTPHSLGTTEWSRPIRLRKGTNAVRATLSRTNGSPAGIRLSWRGRGVPPSPVPPQAWTPGQPSHPAATPNLSAAHRGRDLFLLHRCAQCHDPEVATPVPDLAADAPSFAGIGSRRQTDWLARWIADPHALQPSARMPRLPHGAHALADAADIAAWLGSLTSPPSPPRPDAVPNPAVGRALFDTLLCGACHALADQPEAPEKIFLGSVSQKFTTSQALADYLSAPERHFAWSRMPNFQLSRDDAAHLAGFLMPADPAPPLQPTASDPTRIQRGKRLAQNLRCLRCHADPEASPTPNPSPPAPPASQLAESPGTPQCIGERTPSTHAIAEPFARYRFEARELADLRAFLALGVASLGRHVASDFAERWTRELRCAECHEKVEGLPRLEGTGEKLRAEWFAQCVGGQVPYKPRPWLASRMPGFPAFAPHLAEGYAAREGWKPNADPEPPADPEAAAVGRKLVSASAGFACVTCHAIGPFSASAVFEAPGVNLAHTADRLRPDFFIRWVRNPQSFDPTTKMPLYFDEEGNSALADYYGGDGPKTLQALWEYLRPGPQVTPPEP